MPMMTASISLPVMWRVPCLLALFGMAVPAMAGDLSPLSDFANSPITRESAFLTQDGVGNLATIDQHLPLPGAGGNYAEILQQGGRNSVRTLQDGDANRLRVAQLGNDNLASITQQGARNLVDLQQNGSSNTFSASQIGDDNLIVNLQPGGAASELKQTGNNNVIKLNQGLPGLIILNITQTGNESFVKQN